ncbi:MAG: cobalt chelatase, partial [Lachnospiraceae bacterium]|nr:cobalt chelatase [Lachnospiraceae bacterium]
MKKKLLITLLAGAMTCSLALTGCAGGASEPAVNDVQTEEGEGTTEDSTEETGKTEGTDGISAESEAVDDQAEADAVAALIDAIYVQERTADTDEQCAQAKAAWDALTDAQKELVEGENADSDYFGRDTGDASKDDPRNQDDIGENEILVVSFGTG